MNVFLQIHSPHFSTLTQGVDLYHQTPCLCLLARFSYWEITAGGDEGGWSICSLGIPVEWM